LEINILASRNHAIDLYPSLSSFSLEMREAWHLIWHLLNRISGGARS
jgi:hypothetical protein